MEIDEILAKLPKAPGDVERWIRREVIKSTYIIYSKKENKAVCTRCGHTFRAERLDVEHGMKGMCPRCKSEAVYKAAGRGRKKCTEYFRILLFTHRGKTVYGTLWEIAADFTDFGIPKLYRWLSAVYLFSQNEQIYYKHIPESCFEPEQWERRKRVKLPPPPHPMFEPTKFHTTALYEKNLESVFTKSCLKFFWDEWFLQRINLNAYGYIEYISLSLKHHSLELLRKAGFVDLAEEKILGKRYDYKERAQINWRGKSLEKILKLPRRHVRRLQKMNPDHRTLGVFQSLTEEEKCMPDRFMKVFRSDPRRIKPIRKYTTLTKWYRYFESQRYIVEPGDWVDYIEAAEKLGMDIERKCVLFPDNFRKAHDETISRLEGEKNKDLDKAIHQHTADISIERNGLVAVMARSQTDLNMESAALKHCVRQYGDRIIRGECYIFFIRRADDIKTPYYTLESDWWGKVVQCRGRKNCGMTDDIKNFVADFGMEWPGMLEKMKKEKKIV